MVNKSNTKEILEELDRMRYKQNLILSALRNLLFYNNPSGVNNYLISLIESADLQDKKQ